MKRPMANPVPSCSGKTSSRFDPTENGVLIAMMGAGLVIGALTAIVADWVSTKVMNH